MALYSTPDLERKTSIPHLSEFRQVLARMTPVEIQAVEEALRSRVGAAALNPPYHGVECSPFFCSPRGA